jgi:hypothetical protein
MKNILPYSFWLLLLFTGCGKKEALPVTTVASNAGFTPYTIRKGQQFSDQAAVKAVEVSEMKFVVRFDSTAIYQTTSPENQYDINKLYGFSDNNAGHHEFSARFGWRWSENRLRLFAYVYNEGAVMSKELAAVAIGKEIRCSIGVTPGSYTFSVDDTSEKMPRLAKTPKGVGYQLYPYFGGDEAAPHDITIWLK